MWREGEAAATGTPQRLQRNPRRLELSREVGFESQLELDDNGGGVAGDERTGDISDSLSKCERKSRRGHDDRRRDKDIKGASSAARTKADVMSSMKYRPAMRDVKVVASI